MSLSRRTALMAIVASLLARPSRGQGETIPSGALTIDLNKWDRVRVVLGEKHITLTAKNIFEALQ